MNGRLKWGEAEARKILQSFEVEAREILQQLEAVQTGSHFVGTSGKHLDAYIDKDRIGMNPQSLNRLAFLLVGKLAALMDFRPITAVVGAPMGAITLASLVTYWMNVKIGSDTIKSVYAEKEHADNADEAQFKIRPAFGRVLDGRKVLAVEDILNQGGSALKTLAAIRLVGGEPVGVVALCNRGGVTAEKLGVSFVCSLLDISLAAYDAKDCPMCAKGVPMRTDLGHGANFLKRKQAGASSQG